LEDTDGVFVNPQFNVAALFMTCLKDRLIGSSSSVNGKKARFLAVQTPASCLLMLSCSTAKFKIRRTFQLHCRNAPESSCKNCGIVLHSKTALADAAAHR
jgi:hypothetical protein